MKNWEPGDRAMSEHKRHFPGCSFVSDLSVGNVPIDLNCGISDIHQHVKDEPRASPFHLPKHPEKQSFDSRLQTFRNQMQFPLNAEDLAGAGFYNTGDGDNVKCFHCDGGLRNWERGDKAWEQHAKWFPGCDFLLQQKGQDFINDVHLKKINVHSTNRALPQDGLSPHSESATNVEEQLKKLKEEKACKICWDRDVCIVFLPCGHIATCKECSSVKTCPICCSKILERVRIYMA